MAPPAATAAEVLAFLATPAAYGEERPTRVEVRETRSSWVFLTDRHAYKLKKPIRLPRLDLTSPEARRRHAERELELNRRLAAWVYRRVVPLVRRPDGRLVLDGAGEPVEWLLKMVRLDSRLMLDAVLRAGPPGSAAFTRTLAHLCRFFRTSPPVPRTPEAHLELMAREIALDVLALERPAPGLSARLVDAAIAQLFRAFTRRRAELVARVRAGRLIDAHGDLRPEHIYLGDPPAIIDCLEFADDLRIRDPADEISYLALECAHLGRAAAGAFAIATYERLTGDRPGPALLAFYRLFRAIQRARLAVWHAAEPGPRGADHWYRKACRYLELALEAAPLARA